MLSNDKQKITVEIAGRNYPIIVDENEQKSVQTIVHDVKEKIDHYKSSFNRKDNQDYLAMAFLSYAVDKQKIETESQNTSHTDLSNRISNIDKILDQLIDI